MTDEAGIDPAPTPETPPPPPPPPSQAAVPPRPPFPFVRFLLALGFGVAAWLVFWVIIVLALVQFLLAAVQALVSGAPSHANDELRHFSRNLVQYLTELLGYVAFVRDEKPFPCAPFPKG